MPTLTLRSQATSTAYSPGLLAWKIRQKNQRRRMTRYGLCGAVILAGGLYLSPARQQVWPTPAANIAHADPATEQPAERLADATLERAFVLFARVATQTDRLLPKPAETTQTQVTATDQPPVTADAKPTPEPQTPGSLTTGSLTTGSLTPAAPKPNKPATTSIGESTSAKKTAKTLSPFDPDNIYKQR
jgi:hypothetical protein